MPMTASQPSTSCEVDVVSPLTPVKKFERLNTACTPEKLFTRPVHGERSIYDAESTESPGDSVDRAKRKWEEWASPPGSPASAPLAVVKKPNLVESSTIDLTQGGYSSPTNDHRMPGLVTIHKKPEMQPSNGLTKNSDIPIYSNNSSPEKLSSQPEPAPKKRAPVIYYGSRTHKQLEQVVREFERTPYCGRARMSVLSSREHSCLRPLDRARWPSRSDMCMACIKKKPSSCRDDAAAATDCTYYERRASLNHAALPGAFSLARLVAEGEARAACPYYAARLMAAASDIVFCPYNYLIDPAVRSSMNISVADNILIIDEAHNIEAACREAASFSVTQDQLAAALAELETTSNYRFSNHGADAIISILKKSLNKWDYWFGNQRKLAVAGGAGEDAFTWSSAAAFVDTLDNHDIGRADYPVFSHSAQQFCRRYNDEPRIFIGVTQATCALVDTIDTLLGYLLRNNGEHMDDFVMALGYSEEGGRQGGGALSLRALCMSPGVVFGALRGARCTLLASGTLAPLAPLAAELGASFPHAATTEHVVPPHRVWIGAVSRGACGSRLRLTFAAWREAGVRDALGGALLAACRAAPHGVLAFLPSYELIAMLRHRWRETGLWERLADTKRVFTESKNVSEHNDIMEEYYAHAGRGRGALLLAVYSGKVAEGMDFRDHQARLVVAMGIPFPSVRKPEVVHKRQYNDRRARAGAALLCGQEWYTAQAFRALSQAVGRCVRHRADWGGVLLLDERLAQAQYAARLPAWLREQLLRKSPYTIEGLEQDADGLRAFMQAMTLEDRDS